MHPLKPLLLLIAALSLAACHSTRELTAAPDTAVTSGAETAARRYAERVNAGALRDKAFTAHIKMDLNAAGHNLNVGGQLRMKRDEVIRLSLTFLGIEVGRMEFTPAEVLLMDRVNQQYVRARYSDISFLRTAGLDFYALQSLFRHELFTPGTQHADLTRFTMGTAGDHTLLTLPDAPALEYAFLTATATALIDRVTVESKTGAAAGRFEWRYADFAKYSGRTFPTTMRCTVNAEGRSAGFTLSLSRMNNDDAWASFTEVPAKYKQRRADDILRALLQQ